MRVDLRTIDRDVHDVVVLLNHIDGVTTRASCQGAGEHAGLHRHAAAAYVLFRHALPLRLQEFLVAHLGAVARIEDTGIYSRWPARNTAFLDQLLTTARTYLDRQRPGYSHHKSWPLSRLRARLARPIARAQEVHVVLCRDCEDFSFEPHPPSHDRLPVLSLPPNQEAVWFAEFVRQPRNALDPSLIAADGWPQLLARTKRGEFGTAFQRRWLRHRAVMIADLTTHQLRAGVATLRRQGADFDFFYDDTHAVVRWNF